MSSIQERLQRLRSAAKERSHQLNQNASSTTSLPDLQQSTSFSNVNTNSNSGTSDGSTTAASTEINNKVKTPLAPTSTRSTSNANAGEKKEPSKPKPRAISMVELPGRPPLPPAMAATLHRNKNQPAPPTNTTTISAPVTDKKRRLQVNGECYTILNRIATGGSSMVYQAIRERQCTVVAVKCVELSKVDGPAREAYENEIALLRSLQGSPYVIRMLDFEKRNHKLYVVMEKGDVDLATFLLKRREQVDSKFIKYHWQELLRCVKVIHDRKIVHSDLKPANFLFVGASLKLIDFGIASRILPDRTSVLRDVQIGTLSYMSPEAISGCYTESDGSIRYKIPLKSDVWSLGCILYCMVYGRTPFQHINNQLAKIQAITNPKHSIAFTPIDDQLLMDVIKKCLVREVKERASVDELLSHPYLK